MSQDPNFNVPMAQEAKPGPAKASGTSGKAIASLVLGLFSIVGMCLTGIPGLILGIMGLNDVGKSAGRLKGKGLAICGIVLSSLGIFWTVVAILIGMLLPAVQSVRSAARQVQAQNNMRQQALAMLNYESAYRKFPKQDNNGLSWRVHILPFLGEDLLYSEFNLDEPWDSPNNIALLPAMPIFFECPSANVPPGFTVYQVPYSDMKSNPELEVSAMFDNSDKGVRLDSVTDGTPNTILLLEVDEAAAVEWTKPADWKFDPANSADPMHDLGNLRPFTIIAAMADGSVTEVSDTSPEQFEAMITRNGGEDPARY